MKEGRDNGEGSERSQRLVRTDLDWTDKEVILGSEGSRLYDIVEEDLLEEYFESGDSLFGEGCGHKMRRGEGA